MSTYNTFFVFIDSTFGFTGYNEVTVDEYEKKGTYKYFFEFVFSFKYFFYCYVIY